MALTRAQLISGDAGQGSVLLGQVQGVKAGPGLDIATDGTITVNSQTVQGIMRLGQTPAAALAAYNGYTWPTSIPGTAGNQLTVDAAGNLTWAPSGVPPWTLKGQLQVGTGLGTDILLNAGSDTATLVVDLSTASGLVYSNSVTSAMQSPAGNSLQRPNPATPGQFRYNTLTNKFEFATGATSWETLASGDPAVNTFVIQTVPTVGTPSAVIPAGTTAQQQTSPAPVAGYIRYNSDLKTLEVFDGTTWGAMATSSLLGLGLTTNSIYTVSKVTEAAVPPTPGTGQTQAILGSTYYDTNLGQMFTYYSNGGTPVWVAV